MRARRRDVAALERQQPEILEWHTARRVDRQHPLEDRARVTGAAGLRVRDAECVERLEVDVRILHERVEQADALGEATGRGPVAGELPDRARLCDAGVDCTLPDIDGAPRVPALP